MRKSGKRGTLEFSLENFGEIVLVTIGIIAFSIILSSVFGVFSNPDENQGSYEGFISLVTMIVELDSRNSPGAVRDFNAFVKDDTVIVAFPKGMQEISGACNNPNVLDDFLINPSKITVKRNSKTCPIDNSCLCLCREEFGTFSGTDEMIDCKQAACVPFFKDSVKDINFRADTGPQGCTIPLLYGEDVNTAYQIQRSHNGDYYFKFMK